MLFKLFIGCICILAMLYYISVVLQCLFPSMFKITGKEIKFIRAAIPFYYWIAGKEKRNTNKNNTNHQNTQQNEK